MGDRFLNADGIDGQGPGINKGGVFNPAETYEYKAEKPNDALLTRLEANGGWSESPPWPNGSVPAPVSNGFYHNSGRKFTAREDMNESDWTDVNEIRRGWDAALVRIPVGTAEAPKTIKSMM